MIMETCAFLHLLLFASAALGRADAQETNVTPQSREDFRAFLEACEESFKSVVGDVHVLRHEIIDSQAGGPYLSTYFYKISSEDGEDRGPYKFECRQSPGERMLLYSEF